MSYLPNSGTPNQQMPLDLPGSASDTHANLLKSKGPRSRQQSEQRISSPVAEATRGVVSRPRLRRCGAPPGFRERRSVARRGPKASTAACRWHHGAPERSVARHGVGVRGLEKLLIWPDRISLSSAAAARQGASVEIPLDR